MNDQANIEGQINWKSPSNIALIKYWGKHGTQLPCNPSLSMTLQKSVTTTRIQYKEKSEDGIALQFTFEGKPAPAFEKRMLKFLESVRHAYPFLERFRFDVHSHNSFPHSSGIASSASAYSALALGLTSIQYVLDQRTIPDADFLKKASVLARLGSGSASRSVYGGFVCWGDMEGGYPDYNDQFAHPFTGKIHPVFENLQDAILIISGAEKKVGSTAGHALMKGHPFAAARFEQARKHMHLMHEIMGDGNLNKFIEVVEQEALSLHAMMMSSNPGFLLMENNTIAVIERIRSFRQATGIPLCFTLDAGPNVHLLYPLDYKCQVHELINEELLLFCTSKQWIDDGIGSGPVLVTEEV